MGSRLCWECLSCDSVESVRCAQFSFFWYQTNACATSTTWNTELKCSIC
jgi:hypothetical protein